MTAENSNTQKEASALNIGALITPILKGLKGLVFGTLLWSVVLTGAGIGAAFVVGGLLETSAVAEGALGALILLAYAGAGVVLGVAGSLASTLTRAITEVEGVINRVAERLASGIVDRIPAIAMGRRGITVEEFNRILDERIAGIKKGIKKEAPGEIGGGRFSIRRGVSAFIMRNVLKALRFAFLNDFVESVRREGKTYKDGAGGPGEAIARAGDKGAGGAGPTHKGSAGGGEEGGGIITGPALIGYASETAAFVATLAFKGYLEIITYLCYGAGGVLLIVPVVVWWVWG